MRLTFPNGEHAAVTIEQGQVGVGSAAGGGTSVAIVGLAPLHAVFANGRRGSWLTVPQDATVIVNARPVKRIAHLRAGDLVCLGPVQIRVEASEPPPPAPDPEGGPRRRGPEEAPGAARAVLRGLSGAWFGKTAALTSARTLGRGAGCDIRLDDPAAQERHAIVDIEEGRVVARVASQAGGLRVNGHLVRSAVLSAGDQIEIGEHRFALEAPGLGAATEVAASDGPRREASTPTSMPAVRLPTAPAGRAPARRDLSSVYLLVAAAAALAAALTAFFVYAPKG